MASPLKGKVVLVTGASSGFGEDSARLFASEGAIVLVTARRIERLQNLVDRIQASGGQALAIPADISAADEVENMVRSALELYGHIDILVNNAGFGRLDWLDTLDPPRDIITQVNVNLLGVILTTRHVLPSMLERRQGHIINIASVTSWLSPPRYSIYSATKFGVRGFTNALRREVRQYGLHVSGIYPGSALTEFSDHTGMPGKPGTIQTPGWMVMSSEYVARKILDIARRPRNTTILPWTILPLIWVETLLPFAADWIYSWFTHRKYETIPPGPTGNGNH